jgi:hypothetical protein
MIRRAFLVAAAATALILAPSVAMAYNAPGYTCFVTDSTPASGHPIKVHCSQGHAKEKMTLTVTSVKASIASSGIDIAGTKALTSTMSAAGTVAFTLTLTEAGTYGLVATNEVGAVVSTQTVTVAGAAAVPAATGQLGFTGFDGMPIAIGGGVLVLLGAGVVLVARRRKSPQVRA